MKKDLGIIFGLFFIIVILLIFGGGFTSTFFLGPSRESTQQAKVSGLTKLTVKDLTIDVEVANTPALMKKGLSGRDSMDINRGMLFVFDESTNHSFWMKGMRFAIDIIWIDENKRIVYIGENIPPEPGKKDSELVRYNPSVQSKYVLEINAGISKLHNLQIGDFVSFSI